MNKTFTILVIFLMLISASVTVAQDTSDIASKIKSYGDAAVKGWLGPFEDAFGAGMNSGWYQTANVDDGLSLFVGAKFMIAPVPDESKYYFNSVSGKNEPTFFGPDSGSGLKGTGLSYGGFLTPQLTIGNYYGTRVMIRFLPTVTIEDVGDVSFFGFGVQHSISKHLPAELPVDLAAAFGYQSFKVGSVLDASSFMFGAQASKSFSIIDLYAGLAYESSSMTVSYTYNPPAPASPTNISFDLEGKNNFRFTAGLNVNLFIFKLHADYSLASQPVATVGIGLGW
ncbi:MAG: hypothetical protein HY960_15100 [Ignavibacteriae bacterium]|nr:hypothetical protein [Ignavibacteriota bacterium]